MSFFDEFLSRVPATDRVVLDRHPDLRASIDKMESDLGTVSKYAGEWARWQDQNWDGQAGMTKAEKILREELATAQERINTGGGDAGDLAAVKRDFEAKLAETQKSSMAAIEGMNHFYSAVSSRLLNHHQEFGETLDPSKLMGFMQQKGINDPDIAYDRMVAERRSENQSKKQKELEEKHAADIAAAEQRGREARSQELAMGPGGFLPTDHTGGIIGVTARIDQPAKMSDEMKAQIAEAKLGDHKLAELGYSEYLKGKYTSAVQ